MSTRDDHREWLDRERERFPDGWSAKFVDAFGIEGALDLLAAQGGDPWDVNLTRRPFCNNDALKRAVREAREANTKMSRLAYIAGWEATAKGSE